MCRCRWTPWDSRCLSPPHSCSCSPSPGFQQVGPLLCCIPTDPTSVWRALFASGQHAAVCDVITAHHITWMISMPPPCRALHLAVYPLRPDTMRALGINILEQRPQVIAAWAVCRLSCWQCRLACGAVGVKWGAVGPVVGRGGCVRWALLGGRWQVGGWARQVISYHS